MITKYAAYDDVSIYGLGNSPEEAVMDAREAARDYEAEFETAPIDEAFALEIEENGFNGMIEAFCKDGRGYLIRQ